MSINPIRIGITTGWEPGDVVSGWQLVYTVKAVVEAVEKVGAIPYLLPILNQSAMRKQALNGIDALIAAGEVLSVKRNVLVGAQAKDLESQNPLRFANEKDYLEEALKLGLPILGICRGHQVLNVVCGGEMFLDDVQLRAENKGVVHQQGSKSPDQTSHSIKVKGLLAHVLGRDEIMVNSFHRQAVKKAPPGFEAIALAPDGIIEGIAKQDHEFVVGVQFHPEILPDPIWLEVFKSLVKAGLNFREKTGN